ncbi:F-box/RNI-like superfamily protein [Striga asiatica]|uniref:F-box/RNI-like superfamily protein n=1 Tax=Striga asiatica TaxID=4170 RepID=A0A5A7QVY7_STRAF|nr:F-box/RNI-like superfamily protein [Striga asiatica]
MKTSPTKRRKTSKTPDEDIISGLPEPILHNILSFLPTIDALRTPSLSKTWHSALKSFPTMDFDFRSFLKSAHTHRPSKPDNYNLKKLTQQFYQHVDLSIANRPLFAGVEKFKLAVNLAGPAPAHLDRWLVFAAEKNVRHLVLSCFSTSRPRKGGRRWPYILPRPLVRAIPTLKSLDLFGCRFLERDFCFYENITRFSLTKLRLSHVFVGRETLESVISRCELLTELSVVSCKGFEVVRVPMECRKLEVVEFYLGRDSEVQIVSVLARNVRSVSYGGGEASVRGSLMGSDFFECVEELRLHDSDVQDDFLFRVVPEFGRLEKVAIERCGLLESVRISGGRRLMEVSVSECAMVRRIELDSRFSGRLRVDSGCDIKGNFLIMVNAIKGLYIACDIPMAQFIINMNAALPQSQKFIIHVLDTTRIIVRTDMAGQIRSAIATFREQNTYEKPS